MVDWRVAKSLNVLFVQINDLAPGRSRVSDGSIGDAAHASRTSDHNPWIEDPPGPNVVSARDFTHDPDRGADMGEIFEALRISQDPRIKYGIFNWRIFTYYPAYGYSAWEWRPYSGPNGHKTHGHLSVRSEKHLYDNTDPWQIQGGPPVFLPLKRNQADSRKSDVAAVAYLLNAAYGTSIPGDGSWPNAMSVTLRDRLGEDGSMVTGKMYAELIIDVAKSQGGSGSIPHHDHVLPQHSHSGNVRVS